MVLRGRGLAAILKSAKTPSATALLGMKRSGKWLLWKKGLPLEATLAKSGEGRIVYQSDNPAACACQPPDSSELKQQGLGWQKQQEELAVLLECAACVQEQQGSISRNGTGISEAVPRERAGRHHSADEGSLRTSESSRTRRSAAALCITAAVWRPRCRCSGARADGRRTSGGWVGGEAFFQRTACYYCR